MPGKAPHLEKVPLRVKRNLEKRWLLENENSLSFGPAKAKLPVSLPLEKRPLALLGRKLERQNPRVLLEKVQLGAHRTLQKARVVPMRRRIWGGPRLVMLHGTSRDLPVLGLEFAGLRHMLQPTGRARGQRGTMLVRQPRM